MMEATMNPQEKLAREIARLAQLRADYALMAGADPFTYRPSMKLITSAINRACQAIGRGDAAEIEGALADAEQWA